MKESRSDYLCPFCKSQLRANRKIVFSAELEDGRKGLVLLEPELGNYRTITHPSFDIKLGCTIEFFCPICHENLAAKDVDNHLARVLMVDGNNKESEILFSKIVGEKCTYKINNGDIEAYGEDSDIYTNHFGEAPKY